MWEHVVWLIHILHRLINYLLCFPFVRIVHRAGLFTLIISTFALGVVAHVFIFLFFWGYWDTEIYHFTFFRRIILLQLDAVDCSGLITQFVLECLLQQVCMLNRQYERCTINGWFRV